MDGFQIHHFQCARPSTKQEAAVSLHLPCPRQLPARHSSVNRRKSSGTPRRASAATHSRERTELSCFMAQCRDASSIHLARRSKREFQAPGMVFERPKSAILTCLQDDLITATQSLFSACPRLWCMRISWDADRFESRSRFSGLRSRCVT